MTSSPNSQNKKEKFTVSQRQIVIIGMIVTFLVIAFCVAVSKGNGAVNAKPPSPKEVHVA